MPRSSATPSGSADEEVAATSTSAGLIPAWAIRWSSVRFSPCGVTPLSVPIAIFTPAAYALATDSRWTSVSLRALARAFGLIRMPSSAIRTRKYPADRVGTSHVPDKLHTSHTQLIYQWAVGL
nr:hypothetical protein [Spongiactinospora rosea]